MSEPEETPVTTEKKEEEPAPLVEEAKLEEIIQPETEEIDPDAEVSIHATMEKAIDNLSNVALNTKASRGRIEDADFAKESARLTKAQILQQSAMAMIAQAGKAQQNVLQLLQN